MDPLYKLINFNWGYDLTKLSFFDFTTIFKSYAKDNSSGRLVKSGYQLFISSYFKEVYTAYDVIANSVLVKARCYPTMRKSESPKTLYFKISLDDQLVTDSYCTCKAGKDKCIHVVGLFHFIHHHVMMCEDNLPEEKTVTMVEQEWHKPRGSKIEPEAVMSITFAKPNAKRKRGPDTCSFKEISSVPTEDEIEKLIKVVQQHTPEASVASILTNEKRLVKTANSKFVPLGSTLAHQLKNFQDPTAIDDISSKENIPNLPIQGSSFVPNVTWDDTLSITLDEAVDLEKKTKNQGNELWKKHRKNRLTSSDFAAICKRQKCVTSDFLKNLHCRADVSHIKSIKYGKKNEKVARDKYASFIKTRNGACYLAGLVINPAFPFLGSSPDGIVSENSEVGLLEIKCPSSKEGKSVLEMTTDKKFYLEEKNGEIHLKENSDVFYQIQGQMLVTNTKWCDLCVFNGNDIWIERIQRNDEFCEKMLYSLCLFYKNHYEPYIRNINRKPPTIVFFLNVKLFFF